MKSKQPKKIIRSAVKNSHMDSNFKSYMKKIYQFPILSAEEELTLAKAYQESGDAKVAKKMINCHLKLVVKIAKGYKGYGLPLSDLISEGSMGIMQALKRFDPDKGFRFSTYASWWIQANIKEYVLRSWSIVKIGTTAAQKKLFFSLRSLKSQLSFSSDEDKSKKEVLKDIAEKLNISQKSVSDMSQRMSGSDYSLNSPLSNQESRQWQDMLEDDRDNQETFLIKNDEFAKRQALLQQSLNCLSPREYQIFVSRKLTDDPPTLSDIAKQLSVSRERIRQIELKAFEKVKKSMRKKAIENRIYSN